LFLTEIRIQVNVSSFSNNNNNNTARSKFGLPTINANTIITAAPEDYDLIGMLSRTTTKKILSRVRGDYIRRGFGLTTGFIISQYNYTLTTDSLTITTDSHN
jgi:hypothetical protein